MRATRAGAAAGVYNRRGHFERTIEALRAVAALQPGDPEPLHRIGTFFWDRVRADIKYAPGTKLSYILDAAALDAVSRWRFMPTEIEGRRISLLMTVTVNFTLSPQ